MDAELYKKWGAALKKLAMDPHYQSIKCVMLQHFYTMSKIIRFRDLIVIFIR